MKFENLKIGEKNAFLIMVFLYIKYIISSCTLFYLEQYVTPLATIGTCIILGVMLYYNHFKINKKAIILLFTIIFLYCLNIILSDEKIYVLSWLIEFGMYNVIFLYLFSKGVNYQYLIYIWSRIAILTSLLTFLSMITGSISMAGYMYIGIYMSLNFIIFLYKAYSSEKKIYYLTIVLSALLVILLRANKGALVTCFLGFLILSYSYIKDKSKKILFILIFGFILPCFMFFLTEIFELMFNIAEHFGVSTFSLSRWLYTLEAGFSGGSSGRNLLYGYALDIITNSYGLPGGVSIFYSYTNYQYEYPHNFVLDILIVLGPIIGSIILIFFIVSSIKYYLHTKKYDYSKAMFFLMMMIFFIGRTLTSSTFLKERSFWIIVFMLIFAEKKRRDNTICYKV